MSSPDAAFRGAASGATLSGRASDQRTTTRTSSVLILLIAAAAGGAACFAPPSPTGRAGVDAFLVGLGVAVVTSAAARAPSWMVVFSAAVALTIGIDAIVMVAAGVALGLAVWSVRLAAWRPVMLTITAAISFNALAWSGLEGRFGLSAAISLVIGAATFVGGTRNLPRLQRRSVYLVVAVGTIFAAASTAAFGLAALRSRQSLADGLRWAEEAVASLETGDFEAAEEQFGESAAALERANAELTPPFALGAGFVPVVAQHHDAAVDMSAAGAHGAATVAEALRDIDIEALRPVAGRIDLDELAGLSDPLERVEAALRELDETVERSSSPWLVGRAALEMRDFQESVAEHLPQLENTLAAIDVAPELLGSEGRRTYLVLFTTPAEARGLGGFVGNYAELWADGGRLELRNFGRAQALDLAARDAGASVTGPTEFLDRYGRFGYDRDGTGLVGSATFRNLTMTPNFPWVGEVARNVYAQTTGRTVDGVIAADPYVMAALLGYTGPVQLTSLDQQIDRDNAAWFLLRDQYVLGADDNDERIDAIAEAAELTMEALLGGTMPDPIALAQDLGPLVAERRLLVWSADPAEQDLLVRVHLDGAIPSLSGRDGWSFTVSNSGGSKIDTFLSRAASYESSFDAETGTTTATLEIELTNDAPATGLPRYVIGNLVGLPEGTSRLYVSAYSALTLVDATIDGARSGTEVGTEGGWNVYSRFVEIPPGGTVRLTFEFEGQVTRPHEIVTWEQPMSAPLSVLEPD